MKMFEEQGPMKMNECCNFPGAPNDIRKGNPTKEAMQNRITACSTVDIINAILRVVY